jgi:hypothetical protein
MYLEGIRMYFLMVDRYILKNTKVFLVEVIKC